MLSNADSLVHGQFVGVFIVQIFGIGKNIEAKYILNNIDNNVWSDGKHGYVALKN